jgi:hypothetical protein
MKNQVMNGKLSNLINRAFDRIVIGVLLGAAFPVFCFLVAGTIWFYIDRNETVVLYYVITGLLIGLLIDLGFLKGWIIRRFELPIWFVVALYLFYNIGMYGMFMGFPVFNLFWGVIAGYYFGLRINHLNLSQTQQYKITNRVAIFTAFIMTIICISSACIALAGTGVGQDLQMMFRLNFEVTKQMIIAISLIGGIILIGLQFFITKIMMQLIIKSDS